MLDAITAGPVTEALVSVVQWYGKRPPSASIALYYPRDSYLQFLPKVYSSQDEMRRFLEGFLRRVSDHRRSGRP